MFRLLAATALMLTLAVPARAFELAVCVDPAGLPYSSRDESGYDNRIAAIIADELGADLRFVWMPDHRKRTARGFLHKGDCDVVMGMIDGQHGMMTSHAYYRSTYVFISHGKKPLVTSLDDPALAKMRIGLPGGARRTIPPAISLMRRGYLGNLAQFGGSATAGETEKQILDAHEKKEIDLAILWGPMAGFLLNEKQANNRGETLSMQPVSPEIDIPFLPMFASMTIGVRPHDEALRDAIDHALSTRWDEVQMVLKEAGVSLLDLPRPQVSERVSQ